MNEARPGFSLMEVLLAMIFLSVGILAMGMSTVHVLQLVQRTALVTERNVAVKEVTEQLRAADWETLESRCGAQTFTVGRFTIECSASQPYNQLKKVELISVGPGYGAGGSLGDVADTTAMVLAEPID